MSEFDGQRLEAGRAQLDQGDPAAALELLTSALAQCREDRSVASAECTMLVGFALDRLWRKAEAAAYLREAARQLCRFDDAGRVVELRAECAERLAGILDELEEPEAANDANRLATELHERLAGRYEAVGRIEDAAAARIAAGEGYLRLGEAVEAIECFRQVAHAQIQQGRPVDAAATLARGRGSAEAAGRASGLEYGMLCMLHGTALQLAGRTDQAIAEYEAARGQFEAAGATVGVVRCELLIAKAHRMSGRPAEAEAILRRWIPRLEHTRAGTEYVDCLLALGSLCVARGDLREAEQLAQRALDRALADADGADRPSVAESYSYLAEVRLSASRPAEAIELATRAEAMYRRLGTPGKVAPCRLLIATAKQMSGDLRAAEADLLAAREHLQDARMPLVVPVVDATVALVFGAGERIDGAEAALRAAGTGPALELITAFDRASIELRQGEYAAAAESFRLLEQQLRAGGLIADALTAAALRGTALLGSDRRGAALATLRVARAEVPDEGQHLLISLIERMLACAESMCADDAAASRHLAAAREHAVALGSPFEVARLDFVAGCQRSFTTAPDRLPTSLDLAVPAAVFVDARRLQFEHPASRSAWSSVYGWMQSTVLAWAAESGDATLVADMVEVAVNAGCHVAGATAQGDYLAVLTADSGGSGSSRKPESTSGAARLIAADTLTMVPAPRLRMPDGRIALGRYLDLADQRYGRLERAPVVVAY